MENMIEQKCQFINKIANMAEVVDSEQKKKYRVIVYDLVDEDVLYDYETVGGIATFIENAEMSGGEVKGNHQVLGFGHPFVIVHASLMIHNIQKGIKEMIAKYIEKMKRKKEEDWIDQLIKTRTF